MDNIKHLSKIDSKTNFRIRRIQAIHNDQTVVLYLPHDFISVLEIAKGDYVKCSINNSDNKQLIVEKLSGQ
jgi:hypothetical protein